MRKCINCKLESNATVKSGGFFLCFSCYDIYLEIFGFPEFHRIIGGVPLSLVESSAFNKGLNSTRAFKQTYSIKKASKEDFLLHGLGIRDKITRKGKNGIIDSEP